MEPDDPPENPDSDVVRHIGSAQTHARRKDEPLLEWFKRLQPNVRKQIKLKLIPKPGREQRMRELKAKLRRSKIRRTNQCET